MVHWGKLLRAAETAMPGMLGQARRNYAPGLRHRPRGGQMATPVALELRAIATVGSILGMAFASCVAVDPRSDWRRAGDLILERTGAHEVYDPSGDAVSDERIVELLSDGVTREEAVQIALLNNRGLQAAFETIGASRSDVVQSGLLSNPSLSLSVRFPEGGGRSNLTAGFAQQIVDLWQIPVRKRVAEAELEQVIFSVADQALRLTVEVRRAYDQFMALEQTRALTRENLELAERSLQLAQARFEAGEVGQVDVNLARTNLINLQLEAIVVRRDREEARHALARLFGRSRSRVDWRLAGTWPEPPAEIEDEEAVLLSALQNRPDARVEALRIRAAEAELERQIRNVFPNVTIGLEAERSERRALPGRKVLADTARSSIASGQLTAPSIQSRSERQRERSQVIDLLLGPTLDVTLPLLDQNQAQIAKATFKVRELRAAFENLLDVVAQEVADALNAMQASAELVRFYELEALPQARLSVEAARHTYEAGEQSVLVLIEAQQALIAQQRAQVNALRNLSQAQAELERAVGGRLEAPPDNQPTTTHEQRKSPAQPQEFPESNGDEH